MLYKIISGHRSQVREKSSQLLERLASIMPTQWVEFPIEYKEVIVNRSYPGDADVEYRMQEEGVLLALKLILFGRDHREDLDTSMISSICERFDRNKYFRIDMLLYYLLQGVLLSGESSSSRNIANIVLKMESPCSVNGKLLSTDISLFDQVPIYKTLFSSMAMILIKYPAYVREVLFALNMFNDHGLELLKENFLQVFPLSRIKHAPSLRGSIYAVLLFLLRKVKHGEPVSDLTGYIRSLFVEDILYANDLFNEALAHIEIDWRGTGVAELLLRILKKDQYTKDYF